MNSNNVDIYPVIAVKDNTIYSSRGTPMISNKEIELSEGNCLCNKARYASLMVWMDGEKQMKTVFCNECKRQIIPSEASR